MGTGGVVGLALVVGVLLGACGGGDDGDEGTSADRTLIGGVVVDEKGTAETADDEHLSDAVVVISDAGGDEVGEGTTAANGTWRVEVPGPGEYTATLDLDTVPDGTEVEDDVLEVELRDGQSIAPVNFRLNQP